MSELIHNSVKDINSMQSVKANTPTRQLKPKAFVRVYGCGGGGINLTHLLSKSKSDESTADFKMVYVDTSRANFDPDMNLPEESISLVGDIDEGTDGSGGLRTENVDIISESIGEVLFSHPPEFFNIVLYTTLGGSGSVLGPLIHKELLARGEMVVSLMIGGEGATVNTKNSVGTIRTLDAFAEQLGKPVVCSYVINEPGKPRSIADSRILAYAVALSTLASRRNRELDTADIRNFLDYTKVTDEEPCLSTLEITPHVEEISDQAISAVSIYANKEDLVALPSNIEYAKAGFNKLSVVDEDSKAMYFTIKPGMDEYYKYLEDKVKESKERKLARPKKKRISSSSDLGPGGIVI